MNKNTSRLLAGKAEGKSPLVRPKRRWVDVINMDLGQIHSSSVDWIDLAQNRDEWRALLHAVMNLLVP
jgi:hypothetical protein